MIMRDWKCRAKVVQRRRGPQAEYIEPLSAVLPAYIVITTVVIVLLTAWGYADLLP